MYKNVLKTITPNEWEFFAEDVLFHLGFQIVIGPSEGPDDGMDLLVMRDGIKYLVSCKHAVSSDKNVGISSKSSLSETDILDRIEQHDCKGFVAFYSTGPTSGLKKRFSALRDRGYEIVELYKTDVLEIIPTMRSFTLQKYFSEVHGLVHHINAHPEEYMPLICMEEGCGKDLLDKNNIQFSMTSLVPNDGNLHMLYGCKDCINMYPDIYWAELTQIRHIEQLVGWRGCVEDLLNDGNKPSEEFYKSWALLQAGITQVLVPPGWGRWLG